MIWEAHRDRLAFIQAGWTWVRESEWAGPAPTGGSHVRHRSLLSLKGLQCVERQGLCWRWLCDLKKMSQPWRQLVSCKPSDVSFLIHHCEPEKPLSTVLKDPKGLQSPGGQNVTSIDLAFGCRGDQSGVPWGPEDRAHPLHLPQGYRKSTIKIQVDYRSLFLILSINSKEMPLPTA